MDLDNDVRTAKCDPRDARALGLSKLRFFPAICEPKFIKLCAHAQEILQCSQCVCVACVAAINDQ